MRFPDVEAMLLQFLGGRVDAPLYTTVLRPRPDRFIRLWRNGGPATSRVVDRPMVTIEAWSTDSVDAAALLEDCRTAILHHHTDMPLVRRVVEITGPYSTPDPESETPRYRFSVQFTVRAT